MSSALLNANAVIRCGHGGTFPVAPRGPRPDLGGAPALNARDFPGVAAADCPHRADGIAAPCVITSIVAGTCPAILVDGAPAVTQSLVCATSSGLSSRPVTDGGQQRLQGA